MRVRLKTVLLLAMLVFSFLTVHAWAESAPRPLHVRNHFPPHLMLLRPVPDSPVQLPLKHLELSVSADYASVFVDERSEKWRVLMDMEMAVLDLGLRYGITEKLALSLDLPLISMNAGFLDGFLDEYHSAFGFPDYGRSKRPKNEFAYVMQKDGEDLFHTESGGCHLGDASVSAKLSLADESFWEIPVSLSLSYTLKMPTGDKSQGVGSGGFDHGFFLLSQARFSRFTTYLNVGYILLSDPETSGPDLSVRDMLTLFAGAEYRVSNSWTLSAQLDYYTSPFENTGISQLDDDSLGLALGLGYKLSSCMGLEFAFGEDLTHAAPDFTVHARLIYELGR